MLSVDRFGNIITSFPKNLLLADNNTLSINIKSNPIDHFYSTFGEAKGPEIFAYAGSSGYLEVAINRGSAASSLDAKPGDPAVLEIHA